MRYEFRSATGRVCCSGDNPDALCASCKARAGLTPIQGTKAHAAEHDPLAGYRPTLDKLAPHARQQPQQSIAASSFVPPDSYAIALSKENAR